MLVEYFESGCIAVVDGYSFRKDKHTGYYLSAKPIEGHRKRLHVYVWERSHGKSVPVGYHVHHINGDKNNNEPMNLELLSRYSHLAYHGKNNLTQNIEWREKFHASGIKAAPLWHASASGHKWHKEHYEQMKEKLYVAHEEKCTFCNKSLVAYAHRKQYFCSNKCKSAFRRRSGIDNESRKCEVCGKEFVCSKYSKQRTCSRKCGKAVKRICTCSCSAEMRESICL